MGNRHDLKAYVRYDGSGRAIPGSMVLRRKKPVTGKWQEVQGYQCCNFTSTTTTTTTAATTTTTTTVPSDIRLKDNIVATGNKIGGLNEYSWTWNSTATALGLDKYPTIGVLAQEAKEKYPQYVFLDENLGYYTVDINSISKN